ncbi:MAG TPA: SRPBCC family protein [Lamprocystis sp. (in: g-proteobacteria)]|nr:SRPBCC family protein [Lamprocystis sp. (in: g-proteobacteria)]
MSNQESVLNASAKTLIERPPGPVFDFVAVKFFENYRRWSPEVQVLDVLSSGPIRVGAMARQVRVDHGRQTDTTFKVIAFEHANRLEFAERGNRYRICYQFALVGGHTQLTFAIELARLDLLLRPFTKLIRAAVQDGAERVVDNIKGLVEHEVPAPE